MHSPSRSLIPSVVAGSSGLISVLLGAPWWLTAEVFTLYLVVVAVQSVFPQESADRLAWWRDRRRHQRLRRQTAVRRKP